MNAPSDQVDCPDGPAVPVIILCGGRSRRMGTDKTRLPLVGNTMYGHIENKFAPFASQLVVVAGHATRPPDSDRPRIVVADERADLGPLEGLRVGIQACQELGASMTMVTTADAPMVVPQLYQFMIQSLHERPDCQAIVPFVDDTWHPLTAVYRTEILAQVRQRVEQNRLRVSEMLDTLQVIKLTRDHLERYDPGLQSLRNINTRDQYRKIRRELESPGEPDPA